MPAVDRWRAALVERAEKLCRHRLTIFDLKDHDLGREIRWNHEYKAGRDTPMGFAPAIDYRDYEAVGDCKFVWEPNRHQHLVVLGRAYRLTGEERYAAEVMAQIESWIRQCPFGRGLNWRSPLELAVRLINWAWAIELVRPSSVLTRDRLDAVVATAYRHLWEISRKYSRYSSANNHRIGEAAGVFIGSCAFRGLKKAEAWRRESRRILLEEMAVQTFADGANREQAMGYHLFVLEFFVLAALAARGIGDEFPGEYWESLERMFEFVRVLSEGGDRPVMFGDCDDGYVLDLGERPSAASDWMAVAACLFPRPEFKAAASGFSEPAFWLFGRAGLERFEQIAATAVEPRIRSRAFPDCGRYLLQCGARDGPDRLSVTFDCGDLGYGPIAAHGHADALSFTLRAFGEDVFVDPGTYDYFTYPQWREYFRSTRAHNTVVVDNRDQSEMLGSFLWGRRAVARCLRWEPSADGGLVAGEHDGYTGLAGRVVHRRTVRLEGGARRVTIEDELEGAGRHLAAVCFHLAESCSVQPGEAGVYTIRCERGTVRLSLDGRLRVSLYRGCRVPIFGWVSRGYHQISPATTLVGVSDWSNRFVVASEINID